MTRNGKRDRERGADILRAAAPAADMGAVLDLARSIPGMAPSPEGRAPTRLSRKERRAAKREFDRKLKEAAAEAKRAERQRRGSAAAKDGLGKAKSVRTQLRERDKELSKKTKAARSARRRAKTVTGCIGYNLMFEDGICEVEEGLFSQTLTFPDISYQSAREDRQKAIFSEWCGLHDYFGPEAIVQFSVVNTPLLKEEVGSRRFFDEDAQQSEAARQGAAEFNGILNDKMREGVSNIRRDRYITYAVSAPSADAAVPMLARIRNGISPAFAKIGCGALARPVDGAERLRVIHSLLRPGRQFDFSYARDVSAASALTTKDCIAPGYIDFKPDGDMSCFVSDGKWCQVLVMRRFGSELSDRALSDIVDLPMPMCATWFAQAIEKSKAVDFVKLRNAWIDKEIIEEQRRAAGKGYDFTILPVELKHSKEEAEALLFDLQNNNQRLFEFTGLVYTYADTREELDERAVQIISTARRNGIEIETLDYRQREGLNSVLPLGHNHVGISRYFTTAEASMLIPFATQELDMPGGNYAGQNRGSSNLVICNRKMLDSPVGFICGKPGSGKSFFVKQEIAGTYLNNPRDQVIVFDRAGEYRLLARHFGGTEIRFSVGSPTHLNPFDMSTLSEHGRESQIAFKVDAMLAQAAACAAESGHRLDEGERSIITRAVELAFAEAESEGIAEPLLEDFHRILLEQPEPAARAIALRYERFVKGSMSFFNHRSNVDWSERIVDINIKELPDSMLVFALINMCEAARNQMYKNFEKGVRTWIYIEEIQSLFEYPTVLNYFSRFANESRKFGGILTGITQNAVSMFESKDARSIVLNADFVMLLKQSPVDRQAWAQHLELSPQEAGEIDETCERGNGLLIAGPARVPIVGRFPKGSELYELFSTDPNEAEEGARKAALERNAAGR